MAVKNYTLEPEKRGDVKNSTVQSKLLISRGHVNAAVGAVGMASKKRERGFGRKTLSDIRLLKHQERREI